MRSLFILFMLAHVTLQAAGPLLDSMPLGTYSGASETHESVAFELKKGDKAKVYTMFYDGEGEPSKAAEESVPGTWTYKSGLLTLKYGKFEDTFKKNQRVLDGYWPLLPV